MSFVTINNQVVVDVNKIVYVAILKKENNLLDLKFSFDGGNGFTVHDLEKDEVAKILEKFSSDAASVANVYK